MAVKAAQVQTHDLQYSGKKGMSETGFGPRLREVEQPSSESILKLTPASAKIEDFGRCWRSHVEPWKS